MYTYMLKGMPTFFWDPPRMPKCLSKFSSDYPLKSLKKKKSRKNRPTFPREAPEGKKPVFTMIFFRFLSHNYLKKWTPSLPDMDYFVPTQLV